MNELLAASPSRLNRSPAPRRRPATHRTERDAVMLCYFQRQSARDMAQTRYQRRSRQKRVNRAVDRLREYFAKTRRHRRRASGPRRCHFRPRRAAAPVGLAHHFHRRCNDRTTLATTAIVTATKAIAMTAEFKKTGAITIHVLAGQEFPPAKLPELRGQIKRSSNSRSVD